MTPPVSDSLYKGSCHWMKIPTLYSPGINRERERDKEKRSGEERERDGGEKVAERQIGSGIEHQKWTVWNERDTRKVIKNKDISSCLEASCLSISLHPFFPFFLCKCYLLVADVSL